MRKVFYLLILAGLLTDSMQAAVFTVSNDPNAPAQYTSVNTALGNANPGDTIMVYGSGISYGTVNVSREIVLIGAGYHNAYGGTSYIETLNIDGSGAFSASNSTVTGFIINNFYMRGDGATSKLLEGIMVERCQLRYFVLNDANVTYRNDTLRNCYLTGSYIYMTSATYEGVLFHNNILANEYLYGNSYGTNLSGISARNNIFIDRSSNNVFVNTSGLTLENNIFYAAVPQGCQNCAFNNNLTYANSNNVLTGAGSANTGSVGSGNLVDVNPQFVNYPIGGGAFSYSYDFTVQAASALTAGTDGTVLGIGGGLLPYVPGENPSIPQMTEITFPANASSVKVGGTLDVTFKAKKQD